MKTKQEQKKSWEDKFDEKWKYHCSAHDEPISYAGCVCGELDDLNQQYEDIKDFIYDLLESEKEKK